MTTLKSCVGENGQFIVGIHTPGFEIKNLRDNEYFTSLGQLEDGSVVNNDINFPTTDLKEPGADIIYEIANAFPFRGASYINSAWADNKASRPETIKISPQAPCSLLKNFEQNKNHSANITQKKEILDILPHPLLIALAQASTDPEELTLLAQKSCHILFEEKTLSPCGIKYKKNLQGKIYPDIIDHELFEIVVNNPHLPDDYKNTLVLKPGVQGSNEITGEYLSEDKSTHVFEYLRRNSYIPWGHFASNMANDTIRYKAKDLNREDIKGIRHLYYQRAFVRLASQLNIAIPDARKCLSQDKLEDLRKKMISKLNQTPAPSLEFNNTLWGWNFGFGYAQSGHRLHASHQMIHQQNALIPRTVPTRCGKSIPSYTCGSMVQDFITQYRERTGKSFFTNYLSAIKKNTRTDGQKKGPDSLIIFEDENTLLFVPKAQISEWELQLMPKISCGNIIEADTKMRDSLDRGILMAVQILENLGAQMITGIEFSKPLDADCQDQHLLYSFIPRLPYAPGTFSEAQSRYISGCYPEDVAHACRLTLES